MLEDNFDIKYLDSKIDSIYKYICDVKQAYLSNHLLFLFGDDFSFKNAEDVYRVSDYIIQLFERSQIYKDKITFKYSTPSEYFDTLRVLEQQKALQLPINENEDFFPYSDNQQDNWTGFYSSRPYFKGLVKDNANLLNQSSKLMFDLFSTYADKMNESSKVSRDNAYILHQKCLKSIESLRSSVAISQHHDAITGTARDIVFEDYIKKLNTSQEDIKSVISELLKLKDSEFKNIKICIESIADYNCKEDNLPDIDSPITFMIYNPGLNGIYPYRIYLKQSNIKNKQIFALH